MNETNTNNRFKINKQVVPQYNVSQQKYNDKEKVLLNELRDNLVDIAISSGENFQLNKTKLLKDIKDFIFLRLNVESMKIKIDESYLNELSRRFLQDLFGYGKIDPLIRDDDLEEIMIIGTNKPVFVYHRKYGMMKTNVIYRNEKEIVDLIDSIARQINRRIDQETPILDGRLADGSRVNATIPPVSADGPSVTIRKFKQDPLTIIDLINSKTISSELAAFLWVCLDGLGVKSANAIISGGTSSGKTTTLNALSTFINPKERIITIEDTLELQIYHEHVIRMETRPPNIENSGELTMDDLVKNSLRQRPDKIIVGEVRGKEAITLFTALNTGHSGIGTLHANDARETITRLTNKPMDVPKIMVSAIDFIIMQNRIYQPNGVSYRRISEVAEIAGVEEGTIQLNKLFRWNPQNDEIENVGIASKTIANIAKTSGKNIQHIYDEINTRKIILNKMASLNIRKIEDVNSIINSYYTDKYSVFEHLEM
ncbi:MAG: CpaF family protein [Methanobrevibacter sp.]|uniref:CpaF family protein n=1 Tax=Methanobrevibacter sp. TaxID=66852 RepID=UPI0026DEED72|nr:CpaF family protein [Methanobrevibacter sp.]MDO5848411.1 CpaF family protein [Methanobrevibacter sp.]